MTKQRTPLEPWQADDAARLLMIWDQKKRAAARSGSRLTQEGFGQEHGIGNQGAVWQYLNGRIALNVESVMKFARGLGVEVAEISPTLARRIAEMAPPAPDENMPPNTARYYLTEIEERLILQFRQLSIPLQREVLKSVGTILDGSLLLARQTMNRKLRHVPDARVEQAYGSPRSET